ncbi:hypothetical protein Sango_2424000 [Sesamum angolense]|uniref:Reverse transcriptase zinc-binding domain-containing protein n=1 Tax=Sesamum angolense TaxID=2727404 RepID=A0AAE2BK14_9LAMI|nr:hypothetical protein Sango_2424000 [Sesamum angolense]
MEVDPSLGIQNIFKCSVMLHQRRLLSNPDHRYDRHQLELLRVGWSLDSLKTQRYHSPIPSITHIPHSNKVDEPVLKQPYTEKEVIATITQMSPLKSSGPDDGKKGYAAIKLDMNKAYDWVEWLFLESTLLKLDALSGLFTKTESSRIIQGIRVARGASSISHLLFVDDTLVFHEKSSTMLSHNLSFSQRKCLANILDISKVYKHDKYLGLPSVGGRSKREIFSNIGDKTTKLNASMPFRLDVFLSQIGLWQCTPYSISNLAKRKVEVCDICPVCKDEYKNLMHVLVGYNFDKFGLWLSSLTISS